MTGTDATMPMAESAPEPIILSLSVEELREAKLLVDEYEALSKQHRVFMQELQSAKEGFKYDWRDESDVAMMKALVKSQHDQIKEVAAKFLEKDWWGSEYTLAENSPEQQELGQSLPMIRDTLGRKTDFMDKWADSEIDSSLRSFREAVARFKRLVKFKVSNRYAEFDEDGEKHFKINRWAMDGFFKNEVRIRKKNGEELTIDSIEMNAFLQKEHNKVVKAAAKIQDFDKELSLEYTTAKKILLHAHVSESAQELREMIKPKPMPKHPFAFAAFDVRLLDELLAKAEKGHFRAWGHLTSSGRRYKNYEGAEKNYLFFLNEGCNDENRVPWVGAPLWYKRFAAENVTFEEFCEDIRPIFEENEQLMDYLGM